MRICKQWVLFYIGGTIYMLIEFAWRGRSHGTMFLLGGLCFLVVGHLSQRLGRVPLAAQLLIFAAAITALELAAGLIFNRDHAIWDYRNRGYDYHGQICLNYSLFWIPISLLARELFRFFDGRIPDQFSSRK